MPIILFSCVSTKTLKEEQAKLAALNDKYAQLEKTLKVCDDDKNALARDKSTLETQVSALNDKIAFLKDNNTQALRQLQDMSVISGQQAESIKKSMENIGAKDAYIQTLQQEMSRKDSLNMALVMNLKGAIGNLDDKDINIKVDKGVVFVDISDKLLFKSGSYDVTDNAKVVLGKVATVLKNQPDIEFMVEGHTDNIAFKRPPLEDNWDLRAGLAGGDMRTPSVEGAGVGAGAERWHWHRQHEQGFPRNAGDTVTQSSLGAVQHRAARAQEEER